MGPRVTEPTPATMESVRALQHRIKGETHVETVAGPSGDWELIDGEVVNRRADFFRVIGRRVDGVDHLLLRQTEQALVGLVVSGIPGQRQFLLSARAEPGLHELCQFSTTVQSTPSNFLRRHGGRSTPFLDLIVDPPPGCRALYDSTQYDWGDYYHLKTKRIRIVECSEPPRARDPFVWVDESVLGELAKENYSLTADLRSAMMALAAIDAGIEPLDVAPPPPKPTTASDISLHDSARWHIDDWGIQGEARSMRWVQTRADSREVTQWAQPLLDVSAPRELTLAVRQREGVTEAAVRYSTADGLDGAQLLGPAEPPAGIAPIAQVSMSAEGGRFWRHAVHLRLVVSNEADGTWLPVHEVQARALSDRSTSLELRLLLSLLNRETLTSGTVVR